MKLDPFEYTLLKFIVSQNLIVKGDRVVLAVSGGADSIAMMYALFHLKDRLNAEFIVAHLNHMIRSEASIEGIAVKKMADELGIDCVVESRDVPGYRKINRSLSIEEAARMLRYDFFESVSNRYGANKIATAHHMSDLAENFFLRLFRGSGIGGLVGMRPINGKYIKPFLIFDEQSIRKYVTINRLQFFEDRTNSDTRYLRNRIRHVLIPQIKEEFCPNIEEMVLKTSEILRQYQDHVNFKVEEIFERSLKSCDEITFSIEDIQREELILSELFKRSLKEMNLSISNQKIKSIVELAQKDGEHELNLGKGLKVKKERNFLHFGFYENYGWTGELELSVPGEVKIEELSMRIKSRYVSRIQNFGDNKAFVTLDAEKVKFPLSVRNLRDFERIVPFGMKKEVKVRNILKNHHVPINFRNNFPVISQSNGEIVWVVGIVISENFRVTDFTKNFLILEKEGGKI